MKWCGIAFLFFLSLSLNAQTIATIAGGGIVIGDGGPATDAILNAAGIGAIDKFGNLYVVEILGHRVRKVSPSGIITRVAGTGSSGFSGDGGPATLAKLRNPSGVAVDTSGNIYIAESNNFRIRKIDAGTGTITTIAGTGVSGFYGDGIPATDAQLGVPEDIRVDKYGNVYYVDNYNRMVRKINTAGIISTVAGSGGFSATGTGDGGPATAATFNLPTGLEIDDTGNVYIADYNGAKIRKVDTFGIITTIAGNGGSTYIGDGIPAILAQFNPGRLTFDNSKNLVIADAVNRRVFFIDNVGIIHSIAGNGTTGFSGDGGPATAASLDFPAGVVYDTCGNLYIGESTNKRVRKVTFNTPTSPIVSITAPGTAAIGSTVTVNATVSGAGSGYSIKWYRNASLFTTTTIPTATYTKAAGTDTVTATVISTDVGCNIPVTSAPRIIVATTTTDPVSAMSAHFSVEEKIVVFPNPAKSTIMVYCADIKTAVITNIMGRSFDNLPMTQTNDNVQIDVAQLPAGVYVVRVNDIYFRKFVKE